MKLFYCCLSLVFCLFIVGCASSKILSEQTSTSTLTQVQQLVVTDVTFDAITGKINYTLPDNAYVRIRIGLAQGGPMLTDFIDWKYRSKGAHREIWNGKVGANYLDYRGRTDLMLTIFAYPATETKTFLQPTPEFDIFFPDAKSKWQGHPVLEGNASIRLEVQPKTMQWLSNLRYEIAVYLDDFFIYEEEAGINPYSYLIDTTKYNDGLHHVTVNILSSSGQAGALTKVFMIKNKR